MNNLLTFVLALALSMVFIPWVRWLSFRFGKVSQPREDRWHRTPTPTLGGVGMFAAFACVILVSWLFTGHMPPIHLEILACSALMFFLGLYDDFKRISPPTKFMGQIIIALLAIFLGFTTSFFTTKIPNVIIAQFPNILLTLVWIVGITNAMNLLDNMDGLAGGVSLITALFLSYFFFQGGEILLLVLTLALAGSILGFLVFNFPPAKIFMGDSGSLFLGFTLSILAIARQPKASNVFAVLGVPTLLFLLPILDTTLVTITRVLRGQSPVQGGRDHTSHRLIAFGLNERQALFVMYGVALLSGLTGVLIESRGYWVSLVMVPVLVVSLAILTAYLGRLKVVTGSQPAAPAGSITRWMVNLTYKRRVFEIILDFFIIGIAFYLGVWTSLGFKMSNTHLQIILNNIPFVLICTYASFFLMGVYRGVWKYVGVTEIIRFAKASALSVLLLGSFALIFNQVFHFTFFAVIAYGLFLFLGISATRSSFKIIDEVFAPQVRGNNERILIYGAGDAGEMALRWMLLKPQLGYQPVGFIDNDPLMARRIIHGIEVLGGVDQLGACIQQRQVQGIIISTLVNIDHELEPQSEEMEILNGEVQKVLEIARAGSCWVRSLRLEFEMLADV